MNISQMAGSGSPKSVYAGNLLMGRSGLKSTQEKLERQQKAGNEIAFWEKQKEGLRNMKCDTLEEIARKLEMFHSYEDEIAAVKAAYNREQMSHIMDEAEEMGEKIAEAAEKLEPKTPEERREEMAEEALGTDDDGGVADELLEELPEPEDELTEETLEEAVEEMEDRIQEKADEEALRMAQKKLLIREEELEDVYRPFDARI